MCSSMCGLMDSCPKDVPTGVKVCFHHLSSPALAAGTPPSPSLRATTTLSLSPCNGIALSRRSICQAANSSKHTCRPTPNALYRTWRAASSAHSFAACLSPSSIRCHLRLHRARVAANKANGSLCLTPLTIFCRAAGGCGCAMRA